MKNKKILFTFDYELFLGAKSGSVEKCMIEPTNNIIEILSNYNFKAIFFVDTTYLIRLQTITSPKATNDFNKIKYQIQNLIKKGHYVFPHIHPHWLDAQYLPEINQWELKNLSKYRLHNIPASERELLFNQSINILKELTTTENENYILDSYRAGGWCIQPFEDFKPLFEKFEINYDFSVLGKMKNFSQIYQYDFLNIPQKDIYKFNNDITKEDKNGIFTEFVISTISFSKFNNLLNRILLKYLWKTNNRSVGDGNGAFISTKISHNDQNNLEMISIELLTLARLNYYLLYLKEHNFMHLISHPKMLSKHNINTFKKFLKKIHKKYLIETDFRKMI